jgi:hypothetical protein
MRAWKTLELVKVNPTAHMSLGARAATPVGELDAATLGLATTDQLVPFHCSVSVPLPASAA